MNKKRLCSILVLLLALQGVVCAQKQFTMIKPEVVVANKELADELRKLTWQKADDTWVPTDAQVLNALERLKTPEGAAEVVASAIPGVDMRPSVRLVSTSKYQVFGLVLNHRNHILYDASPQNSPLEGLGSDLWLKQIISANVHDGGLGYWFALYDVQAGRFVLSNHR